MPYSHDSASDRERLKLVVLGCTSDCHEKLDPVFADQGVTTWTLNEYLLIHPLLASASEEDKENALMFQPYIERQIDALRFLPALPNPASPDAQNVALKLFPNERKLKREYLRIARQTNYKIWKTYVGKALLDKWFARPPEVRPLGFVDKKGVLTCKKLKELDESDLLEYYLADYFWAGGDGTDNDQTACDFLGVSLSSDRRFYGYLVVQCPPGSLWKGGNYQWDEPLPQKLIDTLRKAASKEYVPTLALCHHSMAERRVASWLKSNPGPKDKVPVPGELIQMVREFAGNSAGRSEAKHPGSGAPFEDFLDWLWKVRLSWLEELPEQSKWDEQKAEDLKRNLLFAGFAVASKAMLAVVDNAARLGFKLKDELPSSLNSVLVIGGAGAGKDKLTRMVSLLSDGYTFGKIYTFNMAAIRPQELMGPVLQGVQTLPTEPTGASMGIKSVLSVCAHECESSSAPPQPKTVILDELNSMDIDQQGVLLRILENAEVTPLFSSNSTRVNFLCIGVMNEEPEELMKEDELQNIITQNPLLGRILGTLFSELFRRSRRLRPDLYYRMARPGVLSIPSLAERRNDIPLLFYHFLEEGSEGRRYNVELGAYRALMDKTFPWKGNIRELQKLTREIARRAKPEKDNEGALWIIDRSIVQEAVESTRSERAF